MKLKRVLASALLLATLLTLPAWAAQASRAKGEANITPDTPMAKIRSNPSVMGAGLYTYNQEQDTPRDIRKWKDTTLREYVNDCTAEDCAKGLNRMIENYNSGIQITYKLYTDEEIAAVPTRQKAEIYYFPGSDPGGKFVLVIGGNAIHTSAEMREGVSTAEWLNLLCAAVPHWRPGGRQRPAGRCEPGRAVHHRARGTVPRSARGLRGAGLFLRRADRRPVCF